MALKEGYSSVKKNSIHLYDKSKRFFIRQISDNVEEAVTKVTWNDKELPKAKYRTFIYNIIMSNFPSLDRLGFTDSSVDLENFLNLIDERLNHYKWKTVFKALLILHELSSRNLCGDLALLVQSNRPNLFKKRFSSGSSEYAYRMRETSINSLFSYYNTRLNNFSQFGRSICSFGTSNELQNFIQCRFSDKTINDFIDQTLKQLEALVHVKFPSVELSCSFTFTLAENLRNEGAVLISGIKRAFIEALEMARWSDQDLMKFNQKTDKLEMLAIRFRKWVDAFSSGTENDGIRYDNSYRTGETEGIDGIRDIIKQMVLRNKEEKGDQSFISKKIDVVKRGEEERLDKKSEEKKEEKIEDIFEGLNFSDDKKNESFGNILKSDFGGEDSKVQNANVTDKKTENFEENIFSDIDLKNNKEELGDIKKINVQKEEDKKEVNNRDVFDELF